MEFNYNPKENVSIMAKLVRKAFSEDEMAFYNEWLKGMGIVIELYDTGELIVQNDGKLM